MAAPSDITTRATSLEPDSELARLRLEYNKLVTAVRALATKLDADATVTDTNYFALTMDTAVSGPAKLLVRT